MSRASFPSRRRIEMTKGRIVVASMVLATLALAAGCRKRAGGSCTGTEGICLDKTTALTCIDGKFAEVPCRGPMGCAKYRDQAACDTSVASLGDPCTNRDDEYACSPDKKRAFVCKNGKFALHLECRGAGGCSVAGPALSCDQTVAARGDPCKVQDAVACGEDGKHMLVCRNGTFELHRYCRGERGCFMNGATPTCDSTLSLPGDPCGIPGQVVCAVDGRSELVCQGGVFTKSLSCKNGCVVTNRPGRPIECN